MKFLRLFLLYRNKLNITTFPSVIANIKKKIPTNLDILPGNKVTYVTYSLLKYILHLFLFLKMSVM